MYLFRTDANLELVLDIILNLRNLRYFSRSLPETYAKAVNSIRNERERIAAECYEYFTRLKSYGLSKEEIEEVGEIIGENIKNEEHSFGLEYLEMIKLKMKAREQLEKIHGESLLKEELKSGIIKLEKIGAEGITLLLKLLKAEKELQTCENILGKVKEIELLGRIEDIERIFSEFAKRNSEIVENLIKYLCQEIDDHILLPLIKMLNLECLSVYDAMEALDFLVNRNIIDHELLATLSYNKEFQQDFTVFIFLLTHALRIFSYEELLGEVGSHTWKESLKRFSRDKERESLLTLSKVLLIPLSLGNLTYARLAMALATLVANNKIHRRYMDELTLFESLCRSLMNIGRYGEDELIDKLLTYSYFYGDLDAIIKIGELTGIKKSLKKALEGLKP